MLLVLLGLLALRLPARLILGVDLVGKRHEDEANAWVRVGVRARVRARARNRARVRVRVRTRVRA